MDNLQLPDDMQIWRVDCMPVVSTYCRKIELMETVNSVVSSQMQIHPGEVVQAMVLDTLSGRSPLYRLAEFFEHQDIELGVGRKLLAEVFNDTNVGRMMDRIYKAGTMKVFSQVALRATELFKVNKKVVFYDTTSVNVWGDYDLYHDRQTGSELLKVTHGHSKDKRNDLKQFLLEALCVEKNIPIMGGCKDGNSSDKTNNNKVLKNITGWMAKHGLEPGAFIYVADSAMVTEDNLVQMGQNLFVTRLPFNYHEADRVVREAVQTNEWEKVGVLTDAVSRKKRAVASYQVYESKVQRYDKEYRAVVVHSDAHDKHRLKRIEREIAKGRKELEQEAEKTSKVKYYCLADAKEAAHRLEKHKSEYHQIRTEVKEVVKYARGRPAKGKPRKIQERRYEVETVAIEEKGQEVAKKREEAGCFVLLTNVVTEGEGAQSGEQVLRLYKDEHGVERNFGFLKDPLIVNDLFLKSPERIEVLGMILLIALLVWNLIERAMRKYVSESERTMPGWDKKQTDRPTSFMMSTKFTGLMVVKLGNQRTLGRKLTEVQRVYLKAMNITPECLLDPGGV